VSTPSSVRSRFSRSTFRLNGSSRCRAPRPARPSAGRSHRCGLPPPGFPMAPKLSSLVSAMSSSPVGSACGPSGPGASGAPCGAGAATLGGSNSLSAGSRTGVGDRVQGRIQETAQSPQAGVGLRRHRPDRAAHEASRLANACTSKGRPGRATGRGPDWAAAPCPDRTSQRSALLIAQVDGTRPHRRVSHPRPPSTPVLRGWLRLWAGSCPTPAPESRCPRRCLPVVI
jgi:hypothetical protein